MKMLCIEKIGDSKYFGNAIVKSKFNFFYSFVSSGGGEALRYLFSRSRLES